MSEVSKPAAVHQAEAPNVAASDPADATPTRSDCSDETLQWLLSKPAAVQPEPGHIVIGTLRRHADEESAKVTWPGGPVDAIQAMSLVPLSTLTDGQAVAISFPAGTQQPLILGAVWSAGAPALEAQVDGEHLEIVGQQSITLRCGLASITLTADGQVLLRGSYISNHSTGTQRIKGASVRIN